MQVSFSKWQNSLIFHLFILFFLSFLLSRAIVNRNYNLMLTVAIGFILFLILKSNILSIIIILILSFFGNWLEAIGYLPAQFNWLSEIVIVLLIIKSFSLKAFKKEEIKLKFSGIFILFLLISFVSYLLNSISFLHFALFLRLVGRYFLLYLATVNLDLDQKTILLINKIIIFLFLIQIPTAFIKMLIYGQGEQAIGTYALHGGDLSTCIPLMAISFLISFYFLYKPSRTYLVLIFCFIAFGLVGGKKALILFVPILVFFLSFFFKKSMKEIMRYFVLGSLIILLTGFFSMKLIERLNPQRERGGEISLNYLKDYFLRYATEGQRSYSIGRIATTRNVFSILKDGGFESFFFGLGPGSYIETRFKDLKTTLKERGELPIIYGITGFTWLALQVGLLGAIIYLFIFYRILVECHSHFEREKNAYWKSFGLGMVGFSFVMLFINIFYSPVLTDDLFPMIFFLLVAFFLKGRKNQENQGPS